GAGVKWTYYRNARGAFSLSGAAIHSYKDIVTTTAPARTTTARVSLRPKIVQRWKSGFTLEQVSFYQPAATVLADYMVDANTRIGYVASVRSSFFVQHLYRVD